MDIKSDINWIKKELDKVTEPQLIEAIKQLLAFRKTKAESTFASTAKDLRQRAELSMKSIEKGQTRNIREFKKEIETWKNRNIS